MGSQKYVIWTAAKKVEVARTAEETFEAAPDTAKGKQQAWDQLIRTFACGRNIKNKQGTRKRIKKQIQKVAFKLYAVPSSSLVRARASVSCAVAGRTRRAASASIRAAATAWPWTRSGRGRSS